MLNTQMGTGTNNNSKAKLKENGKGIRNVKSFPSLHEMEGKNENRNYGNGKRTYFGNNGQMKHSANQSQNQTLCEKGEINNSLANFKKLKRSARKNWASTLRRFVNENVVKGGDFSADHYVDLHMRQIFAERELANSENKNNQMDSTMKEIPRFYYKTTLTQSNTEDNHFKSKALLRRLARNRSLQRGNLEILTEEDINLLCNLLTEQLSASTDELCKAHAMINYEDMVRIRDKLPDYAAHYFSPDTFDKFRRNRHGLISADLFFQYVCRHVSLCQSRLELSVYDAQGDGYLREQDLENFTYKLIPTLEPLDLEERFYPFYVFTAVRKFFFFLDPRRTCKVMIKDMVVSPVLDELLQLRDDCRVRVKDDAKNLKTVVSKNSEWDDEKDARNWFSAQNALRVYSQYLELDVDHNGMLSKSELAQYGTGTLTNAFIDRVFEECHTYDGEMDYKTFLDFVLAMENKKSPQALSYFWRLLDIKKQGYLDIFTINYFFREIVQKLKEIDGDVVTVEDVKDEIFDMVKPADPTKITFKDFEKCRVGDIIVSMLTDLNGFWEYDNRENIIAEEARQDLMQSQIYP